jgi:RNA recognition motif-containing protein
LVDLFPMGEEKVEHTIFVQNISFSATGESLSAAFQQYGPVKNVRIITRWNGTEPVSRGFGFVEFQTVDGFTAAVNATDRLSIDGRDLWVRAARPARKRDTVFVRGIPEGTTEDDLKAAFAKYNPTEVRLKFFDSEDRFGFAFVIFDTEENQEAAVRENKTILLKGRESIVRFARPPARGGGASGGFRRRWPGPPRRAARADPPAARAPPAAAPEPEAAPADDAAPRGRGFGRRRGGGDDRSRFSYVTGDG